MNTGLQVTANMIVDQRFKLIEKIGVGGMSEVWRAEHLRLPSSVAIKFLYANQMDHEALKRFEREAHIMASLNHAHITRVNDFNILSDGTPYIVLEYLRGEPLSARLERGALDLLSIQDIITQVGSALSVTHAKGIIHRDLKPDNIFLCHHDDERSIHAKVLDFGVSKIKTSQNYNLTQDQKGFLGTPHYMSPEQAKGTHDIDARADQFALAIICYEMLVGIKPFNGNSIFEIAAQVINHHPPPAHHLQPKVSHETSHCLSTALSKDPQQRYSDCRTFVNHFCRSLNLYSVDEFGSEGQTEISDLSHKHLTDSTVEMPILKTVVNESYVDQSNQTDMTIPIHKDIFEDTTQFPQENFREDSADFDHFALHKTPPPLSQYNEVDNYSAAQQFPDEQYATYDQYSSPSNKVFQTVPLKIISAIIFAVLCILITSLYLMNDQQASKTGYKEKAYLINSASVLSEVELDSKIDMVRFTQKRLHSTKKEIKKNKGLLSRMDDSRRLKLSRNKNSKLYFLINVEQSIAPKTLEVLWIDDHQKEFLTQFHRLDKKLDVWYTEPKKLTEGRWVAVILEQSDQDESKQIPLAYIPVDIRIPNK